MLIVAAVDVVGVTEKLVIVLKTEEEEEEEQKEVNVAAVAESDPCAAALIHPDYDC